MLRWIAILLIAALPLRSGMAAAQICPWMAASLSAQATSAAPASAVAPSLQDDCAGMSAVDSQCALQVGCATTPLLSQPRQIITSTIPPLHAPWYAVHSLFTYPPVPQRVPIART